FSDLSHANVSDADLSSVNLFTANLHNLKDKGARWDGAKLKLAQRTNLELLEAEAWQPPPRPES
ncbi:MAG: pentapeptide repeat-containing protein, partial [Deltaproteobacteria bacterium]|nr:pentapeptide repeat-containing protein [Deltaproteobacteria bacterium]